MVTGSTLEYVGNYCEDLLNLSFFLTLELRIWHMVKVSPEALALLILENI